MMIKNEYIRLSDCALLLITNKKGEVTTVYIDNDDVDYVMKKQWCISSKGYVVSDSGNLLLHRYLMSDTLSEDNTLDIDHLDGNPLNNTRDNLRLSTRSENCSNKTISIGKSGVLNIRWIPSRYSWKVEFKHHSSKNFKNFYEALQYRNKRAIELYGEFANIQTEFELFHTGDINEVCFLEGNGYHYIKIDSNEVGEVFTYVMSDNMKKDLENIINC